MLTVAYKNNPIINDIYNIQQNKSNVLNQNANKTKRARLATFVIRAMLHGTIPCCSCFEWFKIMNKIQKHSYLSLSLSLNPRYVL